MKQERNEIIDECIAKITHKFQKWCLNDANNYKLLQALQASLHNIKGAEPVKSDEVKEVLEFYGGEALAASRAMETQNTDAMMAVLTVMSLDAGKRAANVLIDMKNK